MLQFVCAGKFRVVANWSGGGISELQFVCAGKFRDHRMSVRKGRTSSCNSYAQVSFEPTIVWRITAASLLQFVCAGKFREKSLLLLGSESSCNSYAQVSFEERIQAFIQRHGDVAIRMRR